MADRLITIFGGSGFVGRHLVNKLTTQGWRVRVAVRDVEAAKFLKPLGDLGQVSIVTASLLNAESVKRACQGADAVVNLVGILYESGKSTFQAIHADGAAMVAEAAKAAGVKTLVQMSALGADPASPSRYARSKAEGEDRVRALFPNAIILRPSVIFGPEDGFYNRFAAMARLLPVLVYFCKDAPGLVRGPSGIPAVDFYGAGGCKMQPVYVGDVTEAFLKVLDDKAAAGKTYELAGPTAYSLRQIMEQVAHETRRKRLVLPAPIWLAKIQAAILQFLPNPLLTPDQVALLQVDNLPSGTLPGLADLGIKPETVEAVIPSYLDRFRPMHRQIRRLGKKLV
jgi:NADH dehydrogenase